MRNFANDYTYKTAGVVADIADRYIALALQERFKEMRENAKKSSNFNKKLSLWLYRRLSFAIDYKLLERDLGDTKYMNPRNTSSKCPKCGSKLVEHSHRVLKGSKCVFIGDRDVVARINMFLKYSRCGVPGITLNAPKPDVVPRMVWGKRDGGMKPTCIKLYKT